MTPTRFQALFLATSVVFLVGCPPDIPTGHNTVDKNKPLASGATSIAEIAREGDYYVVTGADLHNVCPDLINEKIILRGTVSAWGGPTRVGNMVVLTEDNNYYVQVLYLSDDIPEDLRTQINKGGVQKGDKIILWCTVASIPQESGPNRSILGAKSCVVKHVDKWARQ